MGNDEQFTRDMTLHTRPGGEGRMVIAISLRDHMLGKPVHYFDLEAEVGVFDGKIFSLRGEMQRCPYPECRDALSCLDLLVGERIAPGFNRRVRQVLGSGDGCAHLMALITNLGSVIMPGRAAYAQCLMDEEETRRMMASQVEELGLPGSCPAWREDGPIMRRFRRREPRPE